MSVPAKLKGNGVVGSILSGQLVLVATQEVLLGVLGPVKKYMLEKLNME